MKEIKASDEIPVRAKVNGVEIMFELDTASRFSIIGENVYDEFFSEIPISEPSVNLKSYTGHCVELLGQIPVTVEYRSQQKNLNLVIAKGRRTS